MSRKCLIYHPVAEFPLSDPDFAQEIQERFSRLSDNPIKPTQPEERHLTILGAREYPKVLHPSRDCASTYQNNHKRDLSST